jgi:hypothetical protein
MIPTPTPAPWHSTSFGNPTMTYAPIPHATPTPEARNWIEMQTLPTLVIMGIVFVAALIALLIILNNRTRKVTS